MQSRGPGAPPSLSHAHGLLDPPRPDLGGDPEVEPRSPAASEERDSVLRVVPHHVEGLALADVILEPLLDGGLLAVGEGGVEVAGDVDVDLKESVRFVPLVRVVRSSLLSFFRFSHFALKLSICLV